MPLMTLSAEGGSKSGLILTNAQRATYSKEILYQAQPMLVSAQFATRKVELGRNRGDSLKFTRYNNLVGNAKLSEVENMPTTDISSTQASISVDEYGIAVTESEKLVQTSWDDVIARATLLLGQHYGKTTDAMIQNELRAAGALSALYANGKAGRAALGSADKLNVTAIKDVNELLSTRKAVKINGSYVGLITPHTARGLRDDTAWLDAHKYAAPENIFLGEVGMIEGIRFVLTTALPQIKASTGAVYRDGEVTGETQAVTNATIDTYQNLFLGANAVGWAEALPVEFRDGGVIDYGRTRGLAWYAIQGAGAIDKDSVVVVETA